MSEREYYQTQLYPYHASTCMELYVAYNTLQNLLTWLPDLRFYVWRDEKYGYLEYYVQASYRSKTTNTMTKTPPCSFKNFAKGIMIQTRIKNLCDAAERI